MEAMDGIPSTLATERRLEWGAMVNVAITSSICSSVRTHLQSAKLRNQNTQKIIMKTDVSPAICSLFPVDVTSNHEFHKPLLDCFSVWCVDVASIESTKPPLHQSCFSINGKPNHTMSLFSWREEHFQNVRCSACFLVVANFHLAPAYYGCLDVS
jgi:hypothetical protein